MTAAAVATTTGARSGVALVSACGAVIPLAVERWHAGVDPTERAVLDSVMDPVLDVGCGPGRIVAALAATGRMALGVDTSPAAVAATRRRGAPALRRSVFEPLPGERRWGTALLLDGNIGIGGDPARLLARCGELLRPSGELVAEVDPPDAPTRSLTVRVESARGASGWFPWAQVGAAGFAALASSAGLEPRGHYVAGSRWFARAVKP